MRRRLAVLLAGVVVAVGMATPGASAAPLTRWAVDTSQFNGCHVGWKQVKRAGYDTAIMRVAYVGSHDDLYRDPCFTRHQVAAAHAAGLRVGGYAYTIPRARWAASRDASRTWYWMVSARATRVGDLKPIADIEESAYGSSTNTRWAKAWGWYFRRQGAIVYTSCCILPWTSSFVNLPLWVANYSGFPALPPFAHTYQLWQFSDHGRVPGLSGDVDLNRSRPGGARHIYLR